MILKECERGNVYVVEKSMLKQPAKRRLEALGLIEGTRICKLNEAADGSIIVNVRGTRLAIGNDLANDIIVRTMNASDMSGKRYRHGMHMGKGHGNGRGMGTGKRRGIQS